jgi:4-hydroxybenzoate polyprenyltransferase
MLTLQEIEKGIHPNCREFISVQRLTRSLKEKYGSGYEFELLDQSWRELTNEEKQLLSKSGKAWVRSILHKANGHSVVEGFSIIPEETYQRLSLRLDALKDKPIGDAFLFDNPQVSRSSFYYRKVGEYWERASIFFYQEGGESYPLLVVERFVGGELEFQANEGKLMPYLKLLRLHRPLPILLCLWPTLWGLWLAKGGFPGWKLFLIFIFGVILMRSAGCVFNDIADRKFDRQVERTKARPLASGELSLKSALCVGVGLVMIAFGLVCFTNLLTVLLSGVALLLALLYPWMKRVTDFPQVVLGVAFNFGLIMAFSAVQGHIPLIAWPWYVSAILWTVMYDTYYALSDRPEDESIGVRSTAVFWGKRSFFWIRCLQLGVTLLWGGLLFQGFNLRLMVIFLLILFSWYRQHHFAKDGHYLSAFLDNHWVGFLIFMAIFIQTTTLP